MKAHIKQWKQKALPIQAKLSRIDNKGGEHYAISKVMEIVRK